MTPDELIKALREVPETHLRLVDLAWKVVDEDGNIWRERMAFHMKELDEAIREAQAYSQATREAVKCLIEMVRSLT